MRPALKADHVSAQQGRPSHRRDNARKLLELPDKESGSAPVRRNTDWSIQIQFKYGRLDLNPHDRGLNCGRPAQLRRRIRASQ